MRRIIINCLLLASIASAVPDGRQTRSFSYIKNLIASTFFGGSQRRNPSLQKDPEYQLYKVPGLDEILVKGIPSSSVIEETIQTKPGDVMEITPFESYIGTKNPQDTLITLQNVNNLLSTGILNRQQINSLKETMVPMISHRDMNIVAEKNISPFPVISETIQPILTEGVKPIEVKVNIEEPFQTRYSYKQTEKNEPVMTFSARSNPEISVTQRFARSPRLPLCIQQRINEFVSLDAIPFQTSPIRSFPLQSQQITYSKYPNAMNRQRINEFVSLGAKPFRASPIKSLPIEPQHITYYGQYPNAINRFPPSASDAPLKINLFQKTGYTDKNTFLKNLPLNRIPLPLTHLSELNHIHGVNDDAFKKLTSPNVVRPRPVISSDKIDISQTLGPIPPRYISSICKKMSYELKPEDVETYNLKVMKTTDSVSNGGTVSHYSHNVGDVKEGDEIKTTSNIDTPLLEHHVYIPIVATTTQEDQTGSPISKAIDSKADSANIIYSGDNVPKDETASHFSYKQTTHTNSDPFVLATENDELKTDINPGSPLLNQNVHKLPYINFTHINIANVSDVGNYYTNEANVTNLVKTADNVPEQEKSSCITHEQTSHGNVNTFNGVKEKDELKTNVNTEIPLSNQDVYIPPSNNKNPVNINTSFDGIVTTGDSKNNITGSPKTVNIFPQNETVSPISSKQISPNNANSTFSIVQEKSELNTNVNTDIPLSNKYVDIPCAINNNPVNLTGANIDTSIDSIITKYDSEQNITTNPTTVDSTPQTETVSHNKSQQTSPNNASSTFGIVQEKGELKTNANTDITSNKYFYISPAVNNNAVNLTGANISTSTDSIVTKNDIEQNITNIPTTVYSTPQTETVSHNKSQQTNPNNGSSTIRIIQEKGELKTNVNTDTPLSNQSVDISPAANNNPVNLTGANTGFDSIVATDDSKKNITNSPPIVDNLPQTETVSHNKSQQTNPNNGSSTIRIIQEKGELKTNVNTDTPLSNQSVDISPAANNNPVNLTGANTGFNSIVATDDSKKNITNSPPIVDNLTQNETVSNNSNKQTNPYKPNSMFSIVKEKDEVKTNTHTDIPLSNQYVYIPPSINKNPIHMNGVNIDTGADNIIPTADSKKNIINIHKIVDNLPEKESVSHNSYEQKTPNNPSSTFSILKEKDDLKTNVNTDTKLPNPYVYLPSVNAIPINAKDTNIDEGTGIILKTNEGKANVAKPAHNVTEKETLSEYISVRENHSHPNEFNMAKEKDELKTNLNTETPLQNNHVHIAPQILDQHSDVIKTVEPEPEKGTLSYYIYKQLGHNNPPAFSALDDEDEAKTNIHTDSPLFSHRLHISPNINSTPVKTNIPNIVKAANIDPKEGTAFHYAYKQATHNNPNAFSMVKDGDVLKTNVNTDAPSLSHNGHIQFNIDSEPVSYTTVKEDGLFNNKDITNFESEIESTSTKSIGINPPVVEENTRISFKDNPIVVADSNYVYHQNNADGSSMSIKGDKDGVSVNVNEKPSTGRGDIPGQ